MENKKLELSILSTLLISVSKIILGIMHKGISYLFKSYLDIRSFDYSKENIKDNLLKKAGLFFGIDIEEAKSKGEGVLKKAFHKNIKNVNRLKLSILKRLCKAVSKKKTKVNKQKNYYRPTG